MKCKICGAEFKPYSVESKEGGICDIYICKPCFNKEYVKFLNEINRKELDSLG